MSKAAALLFVYNADSGMFNTLADIGHKIFSPDTYACALCSLTHGYFNERAQWRSFVESLDCDCQFMHRDEFSRQFPDITTRLPAVFDLSDGSPRCCADAAAIAGCADLVALESLIRERCCDPG